VAVGDEVTVGKDKDFKTTVSRFLEVALESNLDTCVFPRKTIIKKQKKRKKSRNNLFLLTKNFGFFDFLRFFAFTI